MNDATANYLDALARDCALMYAVQILGEHLSRTNPTLSETIATTIRRDSVPRMKDTKYYEGLTPDHKAAFEGLFVTYTETLAAAFLGKPQ